MKQNEIDVILSSIKQYGGIDYEGEKKLIGNNIYQIRAYEKEWIFLNYQKNEMVCCSLNNESSHELFSTDRLTGCIFIAYKNGNSIEVVHINNTFEEHHGQINIDKYESLIRYDLTKNLDKLDISAMSFDQKNKTYLISIPLADIVFMRVPIECVSSLQLIELFIQNRPDNFMSSYSVESHCVIVGAKTDDGEWHFYDALSYDQSSKLVTPESHKTSCHC